MRSVTGALGSVGAGLALTLGLLIGPAEAAQCPPDSVAVGPACVDKYEASVWYVPPTEKSLIGKIQDGTVTLGDLTSAKASGAGVVRLGDLTEDESEVHCPVDGHGCVNAYAVSIAGVPPTTRISWPQAAAVARNSRKRLPTNQEWQMAALGTPNGPPCEVADNFVDIDDTGSVPGCVSDTGVFDMVGNAEEWVAEWVPRSETCNGVQVFAGQGQNCFFGVATDSLTPNTEVGALIRGFDGVYAVNGRRPPGSREGALGFRAAR